MCTMVPMMHVAVCLTVLSGLSWIPGSVQADNYVGCLFNPIVCEDEENCFDDNAFGRCQLPYGRDTDEYRHRLGSETTKLLERELTRLFAGGYRWWHEYTQCTVQNILYANRHQITYDPGLCSRIMHFTVPEVPPEVQTDLEMSDPDDLAYIKFNPDREDHQNDDYADEIFSPPVYVEDNNDVPKQTRKRSSFRENEHPEFVTNVLPGGEEDPHPTSSFSGRESLIQQLMEAAEDTQNLIDEYETDDDKYTQDEAPVLKSDQNSDSNHRSVFTESGTELLPSFDNDIDNFIAMKKGLKKSDAKKQKEEDVEDAAEKFKEKFRSHTSFGRKFNTVPLVPEDDNDVTDDADDDNDDSNFRWNFRHHDDSMDDDLTRFALGSKKAVMPTMDRSSSAETEKTDVVEDDYLEDKLYAILPVDNGMSTFTRDMRYDTKKPGPSYYVHEDEDGDNSHDEEEMADEGGRLLTRLMESAHQDQLHAVLRRPIGHGSAGYYLPSEEIIEEERRFKEYLLPPYFPTEIHTKPGSNDEDDKNSQKEKEESEDDKKRNFERLQNNQPELLEGIDDQVADRTANVGQTGEGHLGHFDSVDSTHAYLVIKEKSVNDKNAEKLVKRLEKELGLPTGIFSEIRLDGDQVKFKVNPNAKQLNASDVASKAEILAPKLKASTDLTIESAGIGDGVKYEVVSKDTDRRLSILTFALCGGVAGILLAVAVAYFVRRHVRTKEKLQNLSQPDSEASQDYQDLCRQRMASKASDKPEHGHIIHSPKKIRSLSQEGPASSSSHSSTSSWNEEPVTSNMDISTGHMILSYMEDHLKNKDRLDREWEALCAYEAELCSTTVATLPQNVKKNRYTNVLPYDHSRVVLNEMSNVSGSDYINASSITDHDPRNPAYIATQGALPQTAADFWQMVWEQGSVVIVMLSRLMENGVAMCHRYWPEEGSEVYHIYEVHLVSEHIWCDDYLVRSFYLKNLRTSETRTVTQFHFLSWPENGVPSSTKALLEFRRKVNKSYRGRSCPIVVHCSDGIGRTGTYCLIDMVLNRMAKGAKEIDIAATLEHVRDQRAGMVKTKAQFEFVLMAIAEEVHAILKALSQ